MECFNNTLRIGSMALVAVALLPAQIAAPPASAATTDPGLEELWKQFPLDDQRDEPATPAPSSGEPAQPVPAPTPQVTPTAVPQASVPQGSGAAEASGTSARTALVAAGIALLLSGAGATLVVRTRRRHRSEEQAPPSVDSPQPQYPPLAAAIAPATYPPTAARRVIEDLIRVVDDLLRVPSADSPRHEPEQIPSPAPSEAPTARPLPAATPKRPKAVKAAGESAAVPRKQAAAATKRTPAPKNAPVLHTAPEPEVAEAAPATPASAPRPQECEIRWWRGYMKSQFFAIATDADGAEIQVAASPFFRWSKNEPPPETPAAAAALEALVESLQRKGWIVAGQDEAWFSVRLRAA